MTKIRKEIGKHGEEAACRFLEQRGWLILATNYRLRVGEIDILAKDGRTVVIVEVKTKTGQGFGLAKEKVNLAKQRKLRLLARELSVQYPNDVLRIDVVAIDYFHNQPQIEYIRNAVIDN